MNPRIANPNDTLAFIHEELAHLLDTRTFTLSTYRLGYSAGQQAGKELFDALHLALIHLDKLSSISRTEAAKAFDSSDFEEDMDDMRKAWERARETYE